MRLKQALLIGTIVPSSVLGSIFGADNDIAALLKRVESLEKNEVGDLKRMESLETKVVDLTNKVESQQELIESQQELIENIESLVSSSRMLMDDECYLSFFNETGTPTCLVNYHLTAGKLLTAVFLLFLLLCSHIFHRHLFAYLLDTLEHGLAVMGNASFDGGTNYTFEVNATSNIQGPVTFSDRAFFDGHSFFDDNVSFRKGVEFVGQGVNGVTFSGNTGTTFNGPVVFDNRTRFTDDVVFSGPVEFDNRTTFDKFARFNDDVGFYDKVDFHNDGECGIILGLER
jgi:hypothetical protein